jgi:hypothetical protein
MPPLFKVTGLQMFVPPSLNWTDPVGVAVAVPVGVTVAVKVTVCPVTAPLGRDEATAVDVLAATTVTDTAGLDVELE